MKKSNRILKSAAGFTLAEVLVALLISAIVAAGLAGVWLTANRYMVKSFRMHIMKSTADLVKQQMQTDFDESSRVDFPYSGSDWSTTRWVGMVQDVDRDGCFPMGYPIPSSAFEAKWKTYCLKYISAASGYTLYRHEGTKNYSTLSQPGCPTGNTGLNWQPSHYPAQSGTCGSGNNAQEMLTNIMGDPRFAYSSSTLDTMYLTGGYVYRESTSGPSKRQIRHPINWSFRLHMSAGR